MKVAKNKPKRPFITAISARKGGVGKTSLSLSLALHSVARGLRVLFVDVDVDQADGYWTLVGAEPDSGRVEAAHGMDVVWIVDPSEMPPMNDYDIVIVDGRPSVVISAMLGSIADMIIIPSEGGVRAEFNAKKYLDSLREHQGFQGEAVLIRNNIRGEKTGMWDVPYVPTLAPFLPEAAIQALSALVEKEMER